MIFESYLRPKKNEEDGFICEINVDSYLDEAAKSGYINSNMSIYVELRPQFNFSLDTAYFKVILKGEGRQNNLYTSRIKFTKAEYVEHGGNVHLTKNERTALINHLKTDKGKQDWKMLIDKTNETMRGTGNPFRLPEDLAITDYSNLPIIAGGKGRFLV